MAYIINRFDGTQLTIVDDGILDTSTPVGLIGRNYTGYGEVQNENFIFLLENFANTSPPARALSGQAWYDKGAKALKVYNGTTWLSIGNATVSEEEPAHSNGGLWLKTTTQQLYVSDGVTWRQVGPEAAEGFAVTKMTSTKIKSATGAFYPVILTQINGVTTAIHSDQEFTISADEAIPGFTAVIYPGLNYPSTGITSSVPQTIETLTITGAGDSRFNVTLYYQGLFGGTLAYPVWSSTLNAPSPLDDTVRLVKSSGISKYVLTHGPSNLSYTSTTFPVNPQDINVSDWYDSTFLGDLQDDFNYAALPGPSIGRSITTATVPITVSKYAVTGNLRGNADSATLLQNAKTINGKIFNGSSNIEITAATNQPLKAGDFIIGSEFSGAFETTWDINATSENLIGTVVARNSVGGFSATIINSDLFGDVQGNVTAVTGTSTFNEIVVNNITGETFSGLAARATRLATPRLINTIPFNGTEDITLPVPAETLVGTTLAPNVVDSSLTSLGKLVALEVEAPGIVVGDGNNLNIKIEGFTPTLESDVSNAIKLKLLTGSVTVAPTTITFISANSANADGVLSPAFVPDYTLGTPANQRPVLGLPSHRWKDIYSAAATLDVLKATTLSGRTVADEVTVSNKLIVNNGTYSALFGNVTGNVAGNVTGAASLNVLKTGDTMSGDIGWITTGRGIEWRTNTDGASIRFYNTGDGDADSRLEFNTFDNGNEYFRWTHTTSATTYESMRLVPNSSGNASLTITGNVISTGSLTGTHIGNGSQLTDLNASNLASGTVPSARLVGTYNINIAGNVAGNVTGNLQGAVTGNVTGNVTGSASLNVLKTGDALSGDLSWTTTGRGLNWGMNSDGASIRFYNTSDGDTASRLEFQTSDNGDEYFSWTHAVSGAGTVEAMRLTPNTVSGTSALRVYGNITVDGTATGTFSGTGTGLNIDAGKLITGTVPSGRLVGTYNISISGNANTATTAGTATTVSGGSVNATTATFSGLVNVSTAGIKFPNDPYGGAGDTASITYEAISGEKTRLRFRVANDGGVSPVDDKAEFIVPDNDSLLVNGYITLNAANYNGYSPTLSGTGATGTWGINITGNAATVTAINSTQITNALGYTPVNPSTLANQPGAAISGSTGTFSGRLTVAAGSANGIYFPNDAFGGGSDTARITLETAGGENTRMRFTMTDNAEDYFEFSTLSVDGLKMNGNTVLNAANYTDYAPTKTGTGASGTWAINITGNAGTVSAITSTQVTNALGYTPVNPSTLTNQSGSAGNFASVTATTGNFTTLNFTGTLLTGVGNLTPDGDLIDNAVTDINDAIDYLNLEAASISSNSWLSFAWMKGNWPSTYGAGGVFGIESNATNTLRESVGLPRSETGDTMLFGNVTPAGRFYNGFLVSDNQLIIKGKKITIDSEDGVTITVNASIQANIIGNLTGNASTVTTITNQQVVNALGFTPANQSDLTRVTTSPLQASNITATGTLTVAQGSSLGIRWPNDAYGGGGDTARITLETASGEATRMRFTMTNDADDYFEFSAPSYNGLTMNGYTVHHDGNTVFQSGSSYSISGFTNQVGSWNDGANYFDVYPPAGYSMAHLVAFVPSIMVIHFAGGVNGDDSMRCTWSNIGDRIRVYVQNTEQRSAPAANWLAIWRR